MITVIAQLSRICHIYGNDKQTESKDKAYYS